MLSLPKYLNYHTCLDPLLISLPQCLQPNWLLKVPLTPFKHTCNLRLQMYFCTDSVCSEKPLVHWCSWLQPWIFTGTRHWLSDPWFLILTHFMDYASWILPLFSSGMWFQHSQPLWPRFWPDTGNLCSLPPNPLVAHGGLPTDLAAYIPANPSQLGWHKSIYLCTHILMLASIWYD